MEFKLNSLDSYISSIVKQRWIKKYGEDEIINSINNPADWTQYITQKLLSDNVSVVYVENGYIVDDEDFDELLTDSDDDVYLKQQLYKFKDKLKKFDVYIDAKDYATSVGFTDLVKGAKTIISSIDESNVVKLEQFKTLERGGSQLRPTSESMIIDPRTDRKRGEIQSSRLYFHIDAFYPLLNKLQESQGKTTKWGTNTYDVTPYLHYVANVMDFAKDITRFLAMKIAVYISKYKTCKIDSIRQIMLESDRKWDDRHKEICDRLDITNKSLHKVNHKLDRALPIVKNEVNKRAVIVCRKCSWYPRRYRVVGRLTDDRLIKDLLRNKKQYEVFEYFEHINNPAKAKTDIIKEYKERELLTKDKIKDGDKIITVVRLGRGYPQFIAELRNSNSDYELISSESEDEESVFTAQE